MEEWRSGGVEEWRSEEWIRVKREFKQIGTAGAGFSGSFQRKSRHFKNFIGYYIL